MQNWISKSENDQGWSKWVILWWTGLVPLLWNGMLERIRKSIVIITIWKSLTTSKIFRSGELRIFGLLEQAQLWIDKVGMIILGQPECLMPLRSMPKTQSIVSSTRKEKWLICLVKSITKIIDSAQVSLDIIHLIKKVRAQFELSKSQIWTHQWEISKTKIIRVLALQAWKTKLHKFLL